MFDCIIGIAFISLLFATVSAKAAENCWSLETDDTEITIAIKNGKIFVTSLADITTKYNWAGSGMSVPLMEKVWVGEKEFKTDWKFLSGNYDKKSDTLTLSFENAQPKMALRSIWRARTGHGPVEHRMEIENLSGGVLTISHQDSLSLIGMKCDPKTVLWSVKRGGSAAKQGGVNNQQVKAGLEIILTSNPEDGESPVPWMAAQVGDEYGMYVGWEFSGLGGVRAKCGDNPGKLDINVGNIPDFKTDISNGEIFYVPCAFIGCYAGDLDEGSYSMHRFIIEKLRPPLPKSIPDPILICNPYTDVGQQGACESDVLRGTKDALEWGFELFMNDAMWFPQTGDWRWDSNRFPNGIKPIEEYVHKNGMRIGIWCAWTNGGASPDSGALSVRGPAGHPEWFAEDYPPDWQAGLFWGARACLGCNEYKDWATKKTQWLVEDFKLDYLKHDICVLISQCNKTTHRHKYGVDVSYWHTIGYYEVQDELLKGFPNLILENCNGGGHIKDFAVIQRTHYTVTTDTLSNLNDRQSIWDSTYVLPPLILQAYTYDNMYPVKGDDPDTFLWRSAMMSAWQTAPAHSANWTANQKESIKESVRIYKEWIRPILKDAKVHHILPRPDGVNWDGMFYWSPSLSKGTLYIFRPESPDDTKTIKLKGLDEKKKYWVWCEDGSVPPGVRGGTELMKTGLTIRLGTQLSSDIIMMQDESLGKPKGLESAGEFSLKPAIAKGDEFTAWADFAWEPSANARKYRLLLSESSDFAKMIAEIATSSVSAVINDLSPDKELFWKVEAINRGGSKWNKGGAATLKTPALAKVEGAVYASDIEWVSSTAGADKVHKDENYSGKPLSIGGRIFKKGLWTHAFNDATPADIVVNIERKDFSKFAAYVGLDDASGGGSIQFQVLADGKVVAESPIMLTRIIFRLEANVKGAKQVILRVLNGGDGYSCDHAAWGNAIFTKEQN
jgi:alpha-galactosidase